MDDLSVQIPVWDLIRRFVHGKKPTAEMKAKLAEMKLSVSDLTGGEQRIYGRLVSGAMASLTFFIADVCSSVHSYNPSQTCAWRAMRLGGSLWQGTL